MADKMTDDQRWSPKIICSQTNSDVLMFTSISGFNMHCVVTFLQLKPKVAKNCQKSETFTLSPKSTIQVTLRVTNKLLAGKCRGFIINPVHNLLVHLKAVDIGQLI